jgi:hypothetical protein
MKNAALKHSARRSKAQVPDTRRLDAAPGWMLGEMLGAEVGDDGSLLLDVMIALVENVVGPLGIEPPGYPEGLDELMVIEPEPVIVDELPMS